MLVNSGYSYPKYSQNKMNSDKIAFTQKMLKIGYQDLNPKEIHWSLFDKIDPKEVKAKKAAVDAVVKGKSNEYKAHTKKHTGVSDVIMLTNFRYLKKR